MQNGIDYRVIWKLRSNYIVQYPYFYVSSRKKSSRSIASQMVQNTSEAPPSPTAEKKEVTFSAEAKKRFQAALDNLCLIYQSAEAIKPAVLFTTFQNKEYKRKPVFLTLTVPRQSISDALIKRKCLSNFLHNLTKHWNLSVYIWKAESQARGAIHFHCVIDAFIPETRARRLWYNTLKRHSCIPDNLTLNKSSKLVHFKLIKDVQNASAELGDYFEGERDDEGKLHHKHDKTKRVRDITGRSWGCSDNLRYDAFTIYNVCDELENDIYNPSIKQVNIEDADGKKRAEIYFTKSTFYNETNNTYSHREAPLQLRRFLYMYHFAEACKIYNHANNSYAFEKAHKIDDLFKLANYSYKQPEPPGTTSEKSKQEFAAVQEIIPF